MQALSETPFPARSQLDHVHNPGQEPLSPGLYVGLLCAEASPRGLSVLVPRNAVRIPPPRPHIVLGPL